VYVAVGASETVGVGADDPATQAWPVVLHRRALPDDRLTNVGVSGSTVQAALRTQLPAALAAEPAVVTVWLAVNDVITGVPVPAYQRQLGRLVHGLRRGGRTAVLVGNVPELWRLPAYRACLPGERSEVDCVLPFVPSEAEVRAQVGAFNRAIRSVVRREGARLVDLSGVPFGARLTSSDGFHPSTAGHRRIAAAFAARLP
jgi:lysophospholipase L1-like esterase